LTRQTCQNGSNKSSVTVLSNRLCSDVATNHTYALIDQGLQIATHFRKLEPLVELY